MNVIDIIPGDICFPTHKVTSKFEFQLDDPAYTGQSYNASCTITANPRWNNVYMYVSSESCTFQSESSIRTGQYTTKATIWIKNITSACTNITCSTNVFNEKRVLGEEYYNN